MWRAHRSRCPCLRVPDYLALPLVGSGSPIAPHVRLVASRAVAHRAGVLTLDVVALEACKATVTFLADWKESHPPGQHIPCIAQLLAAVREARSAFGDGSWAPGKVSEAAGAGAALPQG